ncbi:MAG: SIS domain-containing protein [Acidimicrobiales bacterium]
MTDTRVDSLGLWDAVAGFPEQVAAVADTSAMVDLPDSLPRNPTSIVVLGSGASGLAGQVLAAVVAPMLGVPVVVNRTYAVPGFVDRETLVIALSYSGATEETIEATSQAADAGARVVVVTQGGALESLANEIDAPVLPVGDGAPVPRAGIGALVVPPIVLLERLGLFPGGREWIDLATTQLVKRRDELMGPNSPAEALANRIGRTFPVLYGSGAVGSAAATRWKNSMNQNAKIPAFTATMPELCHNELAGFGQHGDVTRQVFSLIQLRHEFEHPQIARRLHFVDDHLEEVVAGIYQVWAGGEGSLAMILDLLHYGDVVSLYLAEAGGVDPGPVPVIAELRSLIDS